jgi:hypothetical protein
MSVIFFEGFNYSSNDLTKLDSNYWSSSDPSQLTYNGGDPSIFGIKGGDLSIKNRPEGSGLASNYTLTLSNFNDPLATNNAFGLGFNIGIYALRINQNFAPLYAENLVSFHDNNGEVLRIDIIKTIYNSANSIGLGIYQNNILVDTYDFRNVPGSTWSINDNLSISTSSYLEIYIDAKNNNQIGIRFSAASSPNTWLLNTSNNIYTNITGFDDLDKIIFYSRDYSSGAPFYGSYNMTLDDLYLTGGNSAEECLLGGNTRVYSFSTSSNDSASNDYNNPGNWQPNDGNGWPSYKNMWGNDGDNKYFYSASSGDTSFFNLSNLDPAAPTGVGGIKLRNVIKKTGGPNVEFINVMKSAEGDENFVNIGTTHTINSTIYSDKNSFVFTNPITSGNWTKSDIDNMQIGIRNLGNV